MFKYFGAAAVAITLALGTASPASAATTCTKGKPCGNACIAKDKECHISQAKQCKNGKPCGDTCIAKDKQCTK